jgi:hypothetical protein
MQGFITGILVSVRDRKANVPPGSFQLAFCTSQMQRRLARPGKGCGASAMDRKEQTGSNKRKKR